jgi:hypothetical protein
MVIVRAPRECRRSGGIPRHPGKCARRKQVTTKQTTTMGFDDEDHEYAVAFAEQELINAALDFFDVCGGGEIKLTKTSTGTIQIELTEKGSSIRTQGDQLTTGERFDPHNQIG